MTYKQIEATREVRLWIGQIIVPAATLAGTVLATNPGLRQAVAAKATSVKDNIKDKFNSKKNIINVKFRDKERA